MYDILDVENKYNVILDMVRDATGMSKVDWLDRYFTPSFIRIVQPRSGVHSEDHLEKIYDDVQDEIIKSCTKKIMKETKNVLKVKDW